MSYQFADLDQCHVKSTSLTLDSVKLPIVGCVGHHVDGEPSAPRSPFLPARRCLSIVANLGVEIFVYIAKSYLFYLDAHFRGVHES